MAAPIIVYFLLATGLIVYTWIQNTYQIDLFATNNRHARHITKAQTQLGVKFGAKFRVVNYIKYIYNIYMHLKTFSD